MLPPVGVTVHSLRSDLMPPPAEKPPSNRALAGSLKLLGDIGDTPRPRDVWEGTPSVSERSALESLRTGADLRLSQFNEERPSSHLRSALGWFRRFSETFPSRTPFVPYANAGDIHDAAYNEETFRLFAEFIRSHGSVRSGYTGMVVSATTIADYVSAIRAFRSREAGYNLLLLGGNLRLPKQLQHMRREDGPAGQREISRGLTARYLRELLEVPGFTSPLREHTLRWAILWVGHNLMLRGGEFGVTDNSAFSDRTGLTIADIDWVEPCEETSRFAAVVVDLMPIKDTHTSRQRIPCLIRRKSRLPTATLPREFSACAWEALRRLWLVRSKEVSPPMWAASPLFAHPDGSPVSTSDVRLAIRQAAAAVKQNANDFDARALRIAGATDLYHIMGGDVAAAERVIQKRGRWCSMIHAIYTRLSATSMLATSVALTEAEGVDLEAFRHGYVMPAIVPRAYSR